jgi:hypothetical protein
MDPADGEGAMFPTGNLVDDLEVPDAVVAGGVIRATLINAGIPTIFVNAADLGYTGTELQDAINGDEQALARFETLRAYGALRMGLISNLEEATTRQHTPKVAFVAGPAAYVSSSGKQVTAEDVDLLVRALSMGKLHHAMMGTAAVAIGTAAAVPVPRCCRPGPTYPDQNETFSRATPAHSNTCLHASRTSGFSSHSLSRVHEATSAGTWISNVAPLRSRGRSRTLSQRLLIARSNCRGDFAMETPDLLHSSTMSLITTILASATPTRASAASRIVSSTHD